MRRTRVPCCALPCSAVSWNRASCFSSLLSRRAMRSSSVVSMARILHVPGLPCRPVRTLAPVSLDKLSQRLQGHRVSDLRIQPRSGGHHVRQGRTFQQRASLARRRTIGRHRGVAERAQRDSHMARFGRRHCRVQYLPRNGSWWSLSKNQQRARRRHQLC